MNKAALAAGMSLSALTASLGTAAPPSSVPPIKVGIIDVRADELTFPDRNTTIEYREAPPAGKRAASWLTESDTDHGQVLASAFVRQVRRIDRDRPIEIYAANPMFETSSATGSATYSRITGGASKRTIGINYEGARAAIGWFKEKGVKVVLTTLNGRDTPGMQLFVKEATDAGMVVFASAGNSPKVGRTFPAAYPNVISVAADDPGLALRGNPEVASWVDFAMSGSVPRNMNGPTVDVGSSFATAKAAALGAYAVAEGEARDRETVVGFLAGVATTKAYRVQGTEISVAYIDDVDGARRARERVEDANLALMMAARARGASR
jgi:hypothetical protein